MEQPSEWVKLKKAYDDLLENRDLLQKRILDDKRAYEHINKELKAACDEKNLLIEKFKQDMVTWKIENHNLKIIQTNYDELVRGAYDLWRAVKPGFKPDSASVQVPIHFLLRVKKGLHKLGLKYD